MKIRIALKSAEWSPAATSVALLLAGLVWAVSGQAVAAVKAATIESVKGSIAEFQKACDKAKAEPDASDEDELKQAKKRIQDLESSLGFSKSPALGVAFEEFWKAIQPYCERPDIKFDVYVFSSRGATDTSDTHSVE